MVYYDPASYRSPETKTEVRHAAIILFVLGALFGLGAFAALVMRLVSGNPKLIILVVALGGIAPLLLAAGAYNIYYTRRMQHHPFMEKALANPAISVVVIMLLICAVVFGGIAILIYLK